MKQVINKSIVLFLNLCFAFGVLVNSSCNKKNETVNRDPDSYYASIDKINNQNVTIVDLSKIRKRVKIPLSELVEDCDIIYLETTDASILPKLRRYAISDNYLCVAGENIPAKLFKRDGSFICDVGKRGQGPGEYSSSLPSQIILEEKKNRIFITAANNIDHLLQYDLQGSFVKKIPLLYKSPKARVWIDGDTITIISMVFDDKIPIAYQQTFDGKLIQQLPIIKSLISKPSYDNEIMSSISPEYDFHIISEDTLFHYDQKNNRLRPKLVSLPFQNRGGKILRELPNYYFGTVYIKKANKHEPFDIIINKKTLEVNVFEVVNDYYGGIPVNSLHYCSKNRFIASTPSYQLIDDIQQIIENNNTATKTKQKLKKMLEQLHEDNNDVIFTGKLKQASD